MATDMERLIKDYLAAWNSHDVEKIATFFTNDCVYEDVAVGKVNRGKQEVKAFVNGMLVSFPDFKFELKSSFSAGDWIGSEWIMTGTQAGKSFSIRGASITELRKGKINRNTDYWNLASLMQQVGLLPGTPSE